MFKDLIQKSLVDSQRVLLASINNGLFELYVSSYLAKNETGSIELVVWLSIEQFLVRQDNSGEFEFISLDNDLISKELCYQADMDIKEATSEVAKEAIDFIESFCKEFSLQYSKL